MQTPAQCESQYQLGNIVRTMRAAFTCLSIALIIQVCAGGIAIRFKRSAYIEQNMKEVIEFAKTVVKESDPMIKAVIEALPATENYDPHRDELEAYLRRLDDYNAHHGICAKKSIELMVTFLEVTTPYGEEEEISHEAKEVLKLFTENGLDKLQDEAEKWMESFDDDKFREEYENLSQNEKKGMTSIFTEIC